MPADIVPFNEGDPLTALLLRAAADPAFDVQKFESVIRFLGEREAKANERAFNTAMARAQSELRAVFRDRANSHLNSRYATLDAYLAVVLPAANAHGLSIRFESEASGDPNVMRMFIVISHADGHVSRKSMDGPITVTGAQGGRTQMTPLQAVGSAATYLSRYLIRGAFALQVTDEVEDDDGEAARAPAPRQEARPAAAPPAEKPIDHEAYKQAFRRRLHAAQSEPEVADLLATPAITAWLAAAPARIKGDVDAMIGTKRQILAKAAAPAPTTEPVAEDPPALAGLLARIESATQAELDEMPNTPSFNEALLTLSFPAQDRVDDAFKARAAALKGDA